MIKSFEVSFTDKEVRLEGRDETTVCFVRSYNSPDRWEYCFEAIASLMQSMQTVQKLKDPSYKFPLRTVKHDHKN